MNIDATFWVMISFFIFIGLLVYFKIPQKIKTVLDENISKIKNEIDEADKLKEDAKNILTEHEKKIGNSKAEVKLIYPEDGISPGQACVFYKKDKIGFKVLGGGWIR